MKQPEIPDPNQEALFGADFVIPEQACSEGDVLPAIPSPRIDIEPGDGALNDDALIAALGIDPRRRVGIRETSLALLRQRPAQDRVGDTLKAWSRHAASRHLPDEWDYAGPMDTTPAGWTPHHTLGLQERAEAEQQERSPHWSGWLDVSRLRARDDTKDGDE